MKSSGRAKKNVITGWGSHYDDALACWSSGDHKAAIAILEPLAESEHTSASVLLCARAMIRSERIHDARLWLANAALHRNDDDARAIHLMLLGVIEAREGSFDGAETLFQRSRSCKPRPVVRAEVEYERALAHYLAGSHDQAWEVLATIRPCDGVAFARSLGLRGWLNCARDDYRSAQTAFRDALQALDENMNRDAFHRAPLVLGFAMTTAELDHDPQMERVITEAAKVTWTASLAREHVQTILHIGLAYRRGGLLDEAMRTFLNAVDLSPASGWTAIAFTQCAALALERGEDVSARGFLILARRCADDIEWDAVNDERRIALLTLAEVLARLKDPEAKHYLEIYLRSLPNYSARVGATDIFQGSRRSIYLEHTVALVDAMLGDERGARIALGRVHRAWAKINHRWRARETLTDINRVDPRRARNEFLVAADVVHGRSYVSESSQSTRKWRNSPATGQRERFALRYNLDSDTAGILDLVVQGRSNKEISAAVGRSERTVKNKVCQLYRVVGVTQAGHMQRSELIVRCTGTAQDS